MPTPECRTRVKPHTNSALLLLTLSPLPLPQIAVTVSMAVGYILARRYLHKPACRFLNRYRHVKAVLMSVDAAGPFRVALLIRLGPLPFTIENYGEGYRMKQAGWMRELVCGFFGVWTERYSSWRAPERSCKAGRGGGGGGMHCGACPLGAGSTTAVRAWGLGAMGWPPWMAMDGRRRKRGEQGTIRDAGSLVTGRWPLVLKLDARNHASTPTALRAIAYTKSLPHPASRLFPYCHVGPCGYPLPRSTCRTASHYLSAHCHAPIRE